MLDPHGEAFGTALGPYTSAGPAREHIARLAAEADADRLARQARLAPKPIDTTAAPQRHVRLHWHPRPRHRHAPAAHST